MKPHPPRVTPIKNAYQNIEETCRKKLTRIYPAGIPPFAAERLDLELTCIRSHPSMQDDLEIYRKISESIVRAGSFLFPRGSAAGSFLYYLLGNVPRNPLPAHYYCSECGHWELADGNLFGIDLPQRSCPNCKAYMISDGFNTRVEILFGLDGDRSFSPDYNVEDETRAFFRNVLSEVYPNHEIEVLSTPVISGSVPSAACRPAGFAILPEGCTIEDYPELASYLENGNPCIRYDFLEIERAGIKRINFLPNDTVKALVALQKASGYFIVDITRDDLKKIRWNDFANTGAYPVYAESVIRHLQPRSFTEMTRIEAACHNTTTLTRYENPSERSELQIEKFFGTEEMKKYHCCTRDDFYDAFLALGLPRDTTYKLYFAVALGNANRNTKNRWTELMEQVTIPDDLRHLCEQYLYAFPRCHAAVYTLCNAMLAHYMLMDSKMYRRVMKEVKQ